LRFDTVLLNVKEARARIMAEFAERPVVLFPARGSSPVPTR
jgi:hypothetical protein